MKDDLKERLNRHRKPLPEKYYSDADYGVDADCPLHLIMAFLDSGEHGEELFNELTAYDFVFVDADALDEAATRIAQLEANLAREREAKRELVGLSIALLDIVDRHLGEPCPYETEEDSIQVFARTLLAKHKDASDAT